MIIDNICEQLPVYLLGEMEQSQMAAFEIHLHLCTSCKRELESIWPIHGQLMTGVHDENEVSEVADMKERVLQAAFAVRPPRESPNGDDMSRQTEPQGLAPQRMKRHNMLQRRIWTTVAALILGAATGAVGVDMGWLPGGRDASSVRTVVLASTGVYPQAKATVVFMKDNSTDHIMIDAAHLPKPGAWGCYDVWLLDGHHRRSIAEFVVDNAGTNTVAAHIPANWQFDGIQITLEPNWGNSEPKGPVVLETGTA